MVHWWVLIRKNLSFYFSLYLEGSLPQQKIPRELCSEGGERTHYISMFPWKDFLMGWIRKIQKQKEERDRSGKFKKTRRKEWRKEKEEILFYFIFKSVEVRYHTHVFSDS
jgi:hypothetical protein